MPPDFTRHGHGNSSPDRTERCRTRHRTVVPALAALKHVQRHCMTEPAGSDYFRSLIGM